MNPLQIHLLANHIPVMGVGFAALALASGLVWRSDALRRFGLAVLVGVALAALPVYFSGEPAEKALEKRAEISETAVESHEDLAKVATILLEVLGVLAAIALVRGWKRPVPSTVAALALVAALAVGGVVAWTAHLGGRIRHTELGGAGVPATSVRELDESAAD